MMIQQCIVVDSTMADMIDNTLAETLAETLADMIDKMLAKTLADLIDNTLTDIGSLVTRGLYNKKLDTVLVEH